MGICRKERLIVKGQLVRWGRNLQVIMAFGMEAILLIQYLWQYTEFGLVNGTKITPCVLFFLFRDGSMGVNLAKVMVYLGVVLLLSDAPFMDESTPYVIARSKRGAWWRGECLYIWTATFLYMLFLTVVSILIVSPTITWNELWGSTIVQAVQISSGIPEEIVKVFYPSFTLVMTFLAGWLSMSLLGHVTYAINLITNKNVFGIGTMVFFIMLDPIVNWLGYGQPNRWMYYISPVSWSSMEHWKMVSSQSPLETEYVFGMCLVLLVICTAVIALASRRKQIDVSALQ